MLASRHVMGGQATRKDEMQMMNDPKAGELWESTKSPNFGRLRIVSVGIMDDGKGPGKTAYVYTVDGPLEDGFMISLEADGWFTGNYVNGAERDT